MELLAQSDSTESEAAEPKEVFGLSIRKCSIDLFVLGGMMSDED